MLHHLIHNVFFTFGVFIYNGVIASNAIEQLRQKDLEEQKARYEISVAEGKNKLAELEAQLEPQLEIVFDETIVSCVQYPAVLRPNQLHMCDIARIVIRNRSLTESISGIKVELIDMPALHRQFNNRAFRLIEDFNEFSTGVFNLPAEGRQEIDIARRCPPGMPDGHAITQTYLRLVLPKFANAANLYNFEVYGLTVKVTAHNCRPIVGRFDLMLHQMLIADNNGREHYDQRLVFRVSTMNTEPTRVTLLGANP